MHVEMGADPGRAPKHAGQKKTYKAIAETYAFLPREAVTRFLMSCGECQKRMHINPSTAEFKENDRPTSLVPDLIDYNMPLTATYLKQMKLQCMNTNEQVGRSPSSKKLRQGFMVWLSRYTLIDMVASATVYVMPGIARAGCVCGSLCYINGVMVNTQLPSL
uniref:Nucleolar protein 4-like n=1 Tax=Sinocyclocheilus anshuiensis TaxID=1608454 RepID=A0A671MUA6_9TELE